MACDVDEVIFPLLDHFLEDFNATNGTDITTGHFKTYDFDGPLGLSVSETVEKIYDFLRADHSHIELLEGVEDATGRLSSNYELEIVTARHPDFEVSTWRYLQEKLPNRFRGIKLIGYAAIMEKPVTKAAVCLELGAVALIDDSVGHLNECVDVGVEGVLFGDYAWNQSEKLQPEITRCFNWPSVAEHFNV